MRVETPETERSPRAGWGDAPWPVKAFAIAYPLGFVITWILHGQLDWTIFGGGLLNAAIVFGLVKGNRGAWFVALFFAILGFIGAVSGLRNNPPTIDVVEVAFLVVTTALLFHPETRRWVWPDDRSKQV